MKETEAEKTNRETLEKAIAETKRNEEIRRKSDELQARWDADESANPSVRRVKKD